MTVRRYTRFVDAYGKLKPDVASEPRAHSRLSATDRFVPAFPPTHPSCPPAGIVIALCAKRPPTSTPVRPPSPSRLPGTVLHNGYRVPGRAYAIQQEYSATARRCAKLRRGGKSSASVSHDRARNMCAFRGQPCDVCRTLRAMPSRCPGLRDVLHAVVPSLVGRCAPAGRTGGCGSGSTQGVVFEPCQTTPRPRHFSVGPSRMRTWRCWGR